MVTSPPFYHTLMPLLWLRAPFPLTWSQCLQARNSLVVFWCLRLLWRLLATCGCSPELACISQRLSPLVPSSYQVLRGSVYSFPVVRYSCISQLVLCKHFCVWRCIPDVSAESDVLHVHQLLRHLVLSHVMYIFKVIWMCFFWRMKWVLIELTCFVFTSNGLFSPPTPGGQGPR